MPIRARTSAGTLTLGTVKIKCTLWNKKHYLLIGSFRARQTASDEIEVLVTKKGKREAWKFKIVSAKKVE